MSIIIKGMEMPKSCYSCRLKTNCEECEGYDVYCAVYGGVIGSIRDLPKDKRLDDCPLVELPPHGKLIDAGAFASEMKKRQEEAGKRLREAKDRETAVRADAVLSFLCEVKLTLDAAPTIIETE